MWGCETRKRSGGAAAERLQKPLQALRDSLPTSAELKHHGTELAAQQADAREELVDARLGSLSFFMCVR